MMQQLISNMLVVFNASRVKTILCSFALVSFFQCVSLREKNLPNKSFIKNEVWDFEKVVGTVLVFKYERMYDTNLFDPKYLGQVGNRSKPPFLIFSGRSCEGCDESIALYIHSPADGKLTVDLGQNRYQYPGVEKDYITKKVLYKARVFYGQVLPNVKGVIWYQRQIQADENLNKSIFIADLTGGIKQDTLINDSGQLKTTLAFLKRGLCAEIKGVSYTSEP